MVPVLVWDFPKNMHLVSGLGNPILPKMVPVPVWTGTTYINYLSNVFNIIFLIQLLFYKLLTKLFTIK